MTSFEITTAKAGTKAGNSLLWLFAAALFLSAFLIFSVQPMFAKMVLPLLGGTPAVWNTAMVFFQAALLGGYFYAHLLASRVPFKWQGTLHLAVMASGLLFLPFAVNMAYMPEPDAAIAPAVLVLFAVSIGFPFFALSANAPLLQSWFSRTAHKDAKDPYFLYGVSNVGSVLALLSYPVLIEPLLPVKMQADIWAAGYGLLAVLVIASSAMALRGRVFAMPPSEMPAARQEADRERPEAASVISWGLRLRWILAAAIPASLMLGTTTNISTNIAAAPFLWVLPLALYLGTFIIVFDRRKALPMRSIAAVHTLLLVAVLMFTVLLRHYITATVGINLALFFVSALICHADLAARRPSANKLTEFYFCMSFGGVLGGAATALAAPLVFSTVFEYPLMLAAACLFLPGAVGRGRALLADLGFGAIAFLLAALVVFAATVFSDIGNARVVAGIALFGLLPVAYFFARTRPVKAAATALAMAASAHFLLPQVLSGTEQRIISRDRSFFGISTVTAVQTEDGPVHRFSHGDTVHNTQLRVDGQTRVPLAYYSFEGPFGDIIRATREGTSNPAIAVIGLGAGALSCYTQPGEDWTYFEIDPAVVRLATDPSRFSYVSECSPDSRIVLGDARLTLESEADRSFDLLIVDAFSSDSIPVHLVTTEAINLYRRKLKPDGLLFFHVSNRYLDVASVVVAGARSLGLDSRFAGFRADESMPFHRLKIATDALAVAPAARLASALEGKPVWRPVDPHPSVSAWSDDWSNVFGALLARFRGGIRPVPSDRVAEVDG